MDIGSLWKVYRELDRAKQAIQSFFASLYEPYVQRRHDRNRHKILNVQDGDLIFENKIALFLIYQPTGISNTCFATCRHLIAKGYAPLIVSNTPVAEHDLSKLKKVAWKIICRPNYGYDFGGYRDGVLWLRDAGILPRRLIILNDSIWFPVWPNDTLIDRMEALPADLVGAVMHPKQRRNKLSSLRPAFMESYFYIVNYGSLESEVFWRYWSEFKVSSLKFNAVYRGERSFSAYLENGGLAIQGLISKNSLPSAIIEKGEKFLIKTLEYGAYVDNEYYLESLRLLEADILDSRWRALVLSHIEKVIYRRSSYASFPFAAYHLLGVSFVKKSRLLFWGKKYGTVQIKLRTQLLRAIRAGDIPQPLPEVLLEMEALEDAPNSNVSI